MRVIAGRLGGRQFDSPHGHHTHPMSEKARGGLFNALGDIKGLTFLDTFSGTGALAYEAISRGAAQVQAVELDQEAFKTILQNIKTLELTERISAVRKDVKSWSRQKPDMQFDVVLCDPPYDEIKYTLLIQLSRHAKPGGLIVYSLPPKHGFKLPDNFEMLHEKVYGDATLVFYRRIS